MMVSLPSSTMNFAEPEKRWFSRRSQWKMRAEAYNTMIDLAEDAFKVPIRKKPGAKR